MSDFDLVLDQYVNTNLCRNTPSVLGAAASVLETVKEIAREKSYQDLQHS